MKIVFMGTPDFSVGILEALLNTEHEITAVVTQPDRPKGRGKEMAFSPVKECALAHNIPVLQPLKIREKEALAELFEYEADLYVVAAFGQILSKEILEHPQFGCVNVHASLLPKYRGAAPIQWSIIDGEKVTGVTLMQMNEGLDTGDMLAKVEVEILPTDTGDSLHDKLMEAGAKLMVDKLGAIFDRTIEAVKQCDEESNYAKRLTKELGELDFKKNADLLDRLIRGLNSWPGAYTSLDGKLLKIWEACVVDEESEGEPGTVARTTKDCIYVNTGDKQLGLTMVQLQGKKRMPVGDFLRGYEVKAGTKLG